MGIIKIISGILIVFVAIMSFKHGFTWLKNAPLQGDAYMLSWGINKPLQSIIQILTMIMAVLILFPQTFFIGNIIGALLFVLLMCFQLNAGQYKATLTEIPFLIITFLLLYLGYPFKK